MAGMEAPEGRPAESGTTVRAEDGGVRVEIDAVTPREMHAHLERVYERVGDVDDRIGGVELAVERRFSRVDKLLMALGVVVASPKVGGPNLPDLVTAAAASLPL